MNRLANNKIRLSLQILSVLAMLLIENSYGHEAISIYNRYPILVILLCETLFFGIASRSKFGFCCEMFGYLSLFSLALFRVVVEMEGFVTLNAHLYGTAEYVKFAIGIALFFVLFGYYSKRTYAFLVPAQAISEGIN